MRTDKQQEQTQEALYTQSRREQHIEDLLDEVETEDTSGLKLEEWKLYKKRLDSRYILFHREHSEGYYKSLGLECYYNYLFNKESSYIEEGTPEEWEDVMKEAQALLDSLRRKYPLEGEPEEYSIYGDETEEEAEPLPVQKCKSAKVPTKYKRKQNGKTEARKHNAGTTDKGASQCRNYETTRNRVSPERSRRKENLRGTARSSKVSTTSTRSKAALIP